MKYRGIGEDPGVHTTTMPEWNASLEPEVEQREVYWNESGGAFQPVYLPSAGMLLPLPVNLVNSLTELSEYLSFSREQIESSETILPEEAAEMQSTASALVERVKGYFLSAGLPVPPDLQSISSITDTMHTAVVADQTVPDGAGGMIPAISPGQFRPLVEGAQNAVSTLFSFLRSPEVKTTASESGSVPGEKSTGDKGAGDKSESTGFMWWWMLGAVAFVGAGWYGYRKLKR